VMHSPIFAIGMMLDWGWCRRERGRLWLASAMTFGIPGALLISRRHGRILARAHRSRLISLSKRRDCRSPVGNRRDYDPLYRSHCAVLGCLLVLDWGSCGDMCVPPRDSNASSTRCAHCRTSHQNSAFRIDPEWYMTCLKLRAH
jgi:hypothetical protein